MNPQTIARVFGVLYLITFITSIPAVFVFYAPVLDDPRYIVGAGAGTSVQWGALFLTYGTARILLAGDAEAREEEYMAGGPYTGPLTPWSTPQTTNKSELRFSALLAESGAERLELVTI